MMRRLHQPDINGTHAPVGAALSSEAIEIFQEWLRQGNLFAPNTSYTIKKIERSINKLANAPYITELGVSVYEEDGETLILYHSLNSLERTIISHVFEIDGSKIQTAAFYPRSDRYEQHGMYVYIHPEVNDSKRKYFLDRHHAIENVTSEYWVFAKWLKYTKLEFGLLEWKPQDGLAIEGFQGLHCSNDSSGMYFITPSGVTKGTTFQKLIELRYKEISYNRISIAGDSKSTDGPLFEIPHITHIAVGDYSLLQNVPGKNIFVETPDEATLLLKTLM
jgi:hydroxymethylpyrimidine pyrophosphatase-like HAD family hydrolase